MSTLPTRFLLPLIALLAGLIASAAGAADAPTSPPPSPAPAAPPELRLSLKNAVLMTLDNNLALKVERLNPDILSTFADQQRAAFDPVLTGSLSQQRTRSKVVAGSAIVDQLSQTSQGEITFSEYLPTGTTVTLGATATDDQIGPPPRLSSTRAGITVTQALLQGFGLGPNLARLRQARVDALSSEYEFRGFVEALVETVEDAFWNYSLARLQVEIVTESLKLAKRQLDEDQKRVDAGALAPAELPAAEAEVAQREEALIAAQGALEQARLHLLQVVNPAGATPWDATIVLEDRPDGPEEALAPVREHVAVGLRMRPEMNQARLQIRRGDLELVRTRNGLLPKLDLFITLGSTGYASAFHDTVSELGGNAHDFSAGLTLTYPLGKRDDKAQHRRAQLQREQAAEALANLAQLVEVDVRSALADIATTQGQKTATVASRRLRAEALRVETEKLNNGKSTSLLVSQAQRDLLVSQVAEVAAQVGYRKALVHLYRVDGSLLERRGLNAPGRQPAELDRGTNLRMTKLR